MNHYDINSFPELIARLGKPYQKAYYAMYSSMYEGIVTDPRLMLLPIDDHMVHRGDGVFETFKCVDGKIYNMDSHLERLERSAKSLDLHLLWTRSEIGQLTIETIRAGNRKNCLVRLLASRGPGSMGVGPYDCPDPQLYIVITHLSAPFMSTHADGAKLKTSNSPAKPIAFTKIKSCNYLTNALMKKEADDACVDFVVTFDLNGYMAECATESIGVVTKDKKLLFPKLDGILKGTTMMRVLELANKLIEKGLLKEVGFADIKKEALLEAPEVLITGTTRDVIAVTEFDEKPVGNGKPGQIYAELSALLIDDIHNNESLLTQVW